MGCLFVSEGLVNPFITAIDSTLIKANKGHVLACKSSMEKGIVPYSGIDADEGGASAIPKDGYLGTSCI